jgi:hypothetical protein
MIRGAAAASVFVGIRCITVPPAVTAIRQRDRPIGGRSCDQPRPIYGILVAMTVMNWTFASSGRLAI